MDPDLDFLELLRPHVVRVPDRRWLPRKLKKAWQKAMSDDGRCRLTDREWALVDSLSKGRRSRVKYVEFPLSVRIVTGGEGRY